MARSRHVYLDHEEDAALDAFVREYGSSASFVLRLALRVLVGLPVPARILADVRARLLADDDRPRE